MSPGGGGAGVEEDSREGYDTRRKKRVKVSCYYPGASYVEQITVCFVCMCVGKITTILSIRLGQLAAVEEL